MILLNQNEQNNQTKAIVDSITKNLNNILKQLVSIHKENFNLFWNNSKATPQEISLEFGSEASVLFNIASENIKFICKILSINYNKTITLSSVEFLDLISEKDFNSPIDKYDIEFTPEGLVNITLK